MNIFYALAEPKRRSIIEMLASTGELSASDIAKKFRVSTPAISQHLKVLRESKLVHMEKRAQKRIYQLNPNAVHELESWAKQMSQNYDALDKLLKDSKK